MEKKNLEWIFNAMKDKKLPCTLLDTFFLCQQTGGIKSWFRSDEERMVRRMSSANFTFKAIIDRFATVSTDEINFCLQHSSTGEQEIINKNLFMRIIRDFFLTKKQGQRFPQQKKVLALQPFVKPKLDPVDKQKEVFLQVLEYKELGGGCYHSTLYTLSGRKIVDYALEEKVSSVSRKVVEYVESESESPISVIEFEYLID